MTSLRQRGTTLAIGLTLLSLVTLLGLAGASTAHVERLLAQNGLFRENAASAASAGIESAISRIVTLSISLADPATVEGAVSGVVAGSTDRYEAVTRFAGFEAALPQAAGAQLAGAHFEIVSTGFASRRATDRQRVDVMLVMAKPGDALGCEPLVAVRCFESGELARLSWQRMTIE
jgi:Tfp pilus assembly protein PilX